MERRNDSLHGLRAEADAEAAAARDEAARAEARVAELEMLLKARDEDSSPG